MDDVHARVLATYDAVHVLAWRLAVMAGATAAEARTVVVGAFADLASEVRAGHEGPDPASRVLHHVLRRVSAGETDDVPVPPPDDDALVATVHGLPNQQRRAVLLHCGLGLSGPDLARALDLPPSQAASQLRRGVAAVAARLEGHR